MSDFYDNNENENSDSLIKNAIIAVCLISLVFLIFLLVMYKNQSKNTKSINNDLSEEAVTDESDDLEIGKSSLRSEDLDFWDMFGTDNAKDKQVEESSDNDDSDGKPAVFNEQGVKPDIIDQSGNSDDFDSSWETGEPNESTHYAITDDDGKTTWYELLDIAKSPYLANNIKSEDNGMVKYEDGIIISSNGLDVNSEAGIVDMTSAKNNGIKYAMIRSHKRDNSSGLIIADSNFYTNVENANKEGLFIGITVDTEAITTDEAVEEANYAVVCANSVNPKYPIAINIPDLYDNNNRISKLDNPQRTDIIKAFCNQVISYGYKPLIHAQKRDLITKINLENLAEYDVWVIDDDRYNNSQSTYFTDYPYKFTMWQYKSGSNLCDISGVTNLNLSFVNYEQN